MGTDMKWEQYVADMLIDRLRQHHVELLAGEQDSICFFVDPTPPSTRRTVVSDYDKGVIDGAIRELQHLIHASPLLKRAIFDRLSALDGTAELRRHRLPG
ncbi:hypothetical protein [Novosphingobium sp. Chol11]|uniref:hypothetical protein n=1 Tax=Novosphingobium sp. Chol11 TaxID=1385763 RepID=UPI000BE4360C|nr:hypothetical protein [Novosphingobium sp. Chol11]